MSDKYPLAPVCATWCLAAKKAHEHKRKVFGNVARECWRFFSQAHDFMYEAGRDAAALGLKATDNMPTTFRMTINKAAELVQIFGPALYFRNPYRQVTPRVPDIPALATYQLQQNPQALQAFQQQTGIQKESRDAEAQLLEWYLNYLPNELGLRDESRLAIDEALIKGRGVLWHELYSPPDSGMVMPRSLFDSVDNLLIDPDAEKLEDASWVVRIRCQPYRDVEERFGLKPGSLKKDAKGESVYNQAAIDGAEYGDFLRRRGDTSDLFTYYEIWSKCGMGQYLKSTRAESIVYQDLNRMRDELDKFGRYVYLVVADGVQYPLNLPPEVMELPVEGDPGAQQNVQQITRRLQWPVPFYLDTGLNSWPFTELDFHGLPRSVWPMAHLAPGLGELKALNWIFSFLMGRIRTTSRTFLGVLEALSDETKDQIMFGPDLTVIPLKGVLGKKITDCVEFLNHPNVVTDIWQIADRVAALFDKRVGLTELMYGQTEASMRSAAEADVKSSQINVRPGDMAECTESWQSRVARKEAFMARLFVAPQDFAPIVGEQYSADPMAMQPGGPLTQLWAQLVYRPAPDPATAASTMREFDYRIEAGSIRKPNRSRDQSNMNMAMQALFQPMLGHYQQTGDPTQLNAFLTAWAKTYDLDVSPFLFQPPPAPPQPQQAQAPAPQQSPHTVPIRRAG